MTIDLANFRPKAIGYECLGRGNEKARSQTDHRKTWKSMPSGRSSIDDKEAIVRKNFELMDRHVIPQWRYAGDEKQWVLFKVDKGLFAGVVLQQRYNAARNCYLNNDDYNSFNLTSVHEKDSFIRGSFLKATPSRIIPDDWQYKNATQPIPFFFDPSDITGLARCKNNLSLFASKSIIFSQPWCEFNRSLDDPTQEVWIQSINDIDEAIRHAWRHITNPGRIIDKYWTYVDTTTPVKFTFDLDEVYDFNGIQFQQTINHWQRNGINLRSAVDMNQALKAVLSKINCNLVDPSFEYYAPGSAEERLRRPIPISDEFDQQYITTFECLTKGMDVNSIGAGQLPWNRITSRLTPNKIRGNPRFLSSSGTIYVAEIQDITGVSYFKIGITTKQSPKHRCASYKIRTEIYSEKLLDISILESALLRATTARYRPANYQELRFPPGFGGGHSEIRDMSVLKEFRIAGNDSEKRFKSSLLIAGSFREDGNLSSEQINQIVSPLVLQYQKRFYVRPAKTNTDTNPKLEKADKLVRH